MNGVGAVEGVVPGLKGLGCLALVAIGAAKQVVGAHLLVGRAVAVEEAGGLLQQAVRRQLGIGAVQRVGLVEQAEHLLTAACVAGGDEQQHEEQEGVAWFHVYKDTKFFR